MREAVVKEKMTLAAAQAAPIYHDKEATIDKACEWILKAGRESSDLVVFPETFIPGYPYWRGCSDLSRWNELMLELQENSMRFTEEETQPISEAAAKANTAVIIGVTEFDDKKGSNSLYNSLLFVDADGTILGTRRKLMPTHHERAIWGRGQKEDIKTFDASIATLGGTICYETHLPQLRSALQKEGEEVHAAVWPGFWEQHGNPCDRTKAKSREAIETCDIYPAVRQYAFETQSFVVSASPYMEMPVEGYPELTEFNMAAGGSMIVNPAGIVKAGPVIGEEKLLVANVERTERRATKAYFDSLGHYQHPSL